MAIRRDIALAELVPPRRERGLTHRDHCRGRVQGDAGLRRSLPASRDRTATQVRQRELPLSHPHPIDGVGGSFVMVLGRIWRCFPHILQPVPVPSLAPNPNSLVHTGLGLKRARYRNGCRGVRRHGRRPLTDNPKQRPLRESDWPWCHTFILLWPLQTRSPVHPPRVTAGRNSRHYTG